ncbi:MAG: IS200/IS605 family transposase [Gammaproteobacteria bacterium]
MARNYYCEINLHVTWHAKLSRPLITPEFEPLIHKHVKKKAIDLGGIYIHEIGGTETHVHMALSIEPTLTISDMIGQFKGYSAHEINQQVGRGDKILEWQAGYGVVSFGTKDLPWVLAYVRNQMEHHARGTIHDRLERIEFADDGHPAAQAG